MLALKFVAESDGEENFSCLGAGSSNFFFLQQLVQFLGSIGLIESLRFEENHSDC